MAIPLEELTAVALEGSVGPVTLAVGASALAVALAAGSTRPLRRMVATSVVAAERSGQIGVRDWLDAVKHGWLGLVEEARAEYEAGRRATTPVASAPIASPPIVATTSGFVPPAGTTMARAASAQVSAVVESAMPIDERESADAAGTPDDPLVVRTRDRRGRFIRRATNGLQPA